MASGLISLGIGSPAGIAPFILLGITGAEPPAFEGLAIDLDAYGQTFLAADAYGSPAVTLDPYGPIVSSADVHGETRASMDTHGDTVIDFDAYEE